ncbi:VanZ family protein [Virgibacillus oceani]
MLSDRLDLSFFEPLLGWITFTYNGSVVSVATHGVEGVIEFFIRKGAHVAVFFLLTCCFFIAIRKSTKLLFKQAAAISFITTVAYAITDEIHQGFTPNRTPYIGDVLLDSFGGGAAVILLIAIRYRKIRISREI